MEIEMTKTVLITGGNGYLGSRIMDLFNDPDLRVKILDLNLYREGNNSGDIRNIDELYRNIKISDYVIHLASLNLNDTCNSNKIFTYTTNYLATRSIVNICEDEGIEKLIFASTCGLYSNSDKVQNEESNTQAESIYSKTKLLSEQYIKESDLDHVIFRTGELYGMSPRMRFDLTVNKFVAEADSKGSINARCGAINKPYIHIDDASRAYIESINDYHGTYNLTDQNLTPKMIASKVRYYYPDTKIFCPEGGDSKNYLVDNSKLLNEGFEIQKSLDIGIQDIKKEIHKYNYKKSVYNNYRASKWLGLD